jgi:hypothetical protein
VPFETPQLPLRDLLDQAADGRIQLPDFQRPWKWDDERIMSLLTTLTMGYPLGVMMALETGGPRFKPRPLAGAVAKVPEPSLLLMDGQQRLTSLFQALRSGNPVDTIDLKRKKRRRWYYIDIAKAIDPGVDREDAIVSVPENRLVPGGVDLRTPELEAAAGLFPFQLIMDVPGTQRWQRRYVGGDDARWEAWEQFIVQVVNPVGQYLVPVIKLTKDTPKEAVCMVFEKVNTGGVALNVFELMTASYAGDRDYFTEHGEDFELQKDWERILEELTPHSVLIGSNVGLRNTDLLQAVTLVSTYHRRRGRTDVDPYTQPAAACKRKDVLELPLQEYLTWTPRVVNALHWTATFLKRQCIFNVIDLPYSTQLVALAAIRTVLGEETDTDDAYAKISQWYWCGVFGEQYGGTVETRLPRDLEQVVAWVRGGPEPSSVREALFQESRLETLRTRNSAAYKGLFALLMKQGCMDWVLHRTAIDEKVFLDHQVGIHLIFPKAWCQQHGIAREQDSVINKTVLTHHAGSLISTRAPDTYLKVMEAETGLPGSWLDDVVTTHLIDPSNLREPDFDKFWADRSAQLLGLIESAMGKVAVRHEAERESAADYEPETLV